MTRNDAARAGFLDVIVAALPRLRKSEQKVAAAVLSDPHRTLRSGMADLAACAGVSEPTVMRFCAGVGCDSFQGFRIRLAQALALGIPATQSAITAEDDAAAVAGKVFDYSITSLDHARRVLDHNAVERAIDVLAGAKSITFLGLGASGIVAQDAQQKFPLFGVPCSAPADVHQQFISAALVTPQDAVIAISHTGRSTAIIEAASIAATNGASVIGMSGGATPLLDVCDVGVIVETLENTDFYTPTISRLAQLVVIDIFATGVLMRRDETEVDRLRLMKADLSRMRTGGSPPVLDDPDSRT